LKEIDIDIMQSVKTQTDKEKKKKKDAKHQREESVESEDDAAKRELSIKNQELEGQLQRCFDEIKEMN